MTKVLVNLTTQSISNSKITPTAVRLYLQEKMSKKLITARELQKVVDWMKQNPMNFQQQAGVTQTSSVMAMQLFRRLNGKDIPRPEKKKDA